MQMLREEFISKCARFSDLTIEQEPMDQVDIGFLIQVTVNEIIHNKLEKYLREDPLVSKSDIPYILRYVLFGIENWNLDRKLPLNADNHYKSFLLHTLRNIMVWAFQYNTDAEFIFRFDNNGRTE